MRSLYRSNPVEKWMRARGWNRKPGSVPHRLYQLASEWRRPWWDFGNRLMVLTGSDFGGNYQEPEPPTWFYREVGKRRMLRTGFPRPIYQVIDNYSDFAALTEGLSKDGDEHYEWKSFCTNQDGALQFGRMFWGGNFYGLNRWEQRLLGKYLRQWRRRNWFGLRSYLYSQGLHAAVHKKRPGACNRVPPKGSGGYSHWHCQLDRGHGGPHQFNSYRWDAAGRRVEFTPAEAS